MIIHDFTVPQLEYYRTFCNFVGDEKTLFELRASGHTLDECCEILHRDLSSVKKISRKVNKKMIYVTNVIQMEKWIEQNFF